MNDNNNTYMIRKSCNNLKKNKNTRLKNYHKYTTARIKCCQLCASHRNLLRIDPI